jgi:polyisoprenyl-phosphate glycosyltransferase
VFTGIMAVLIGTWAVVQKLRGAPTVEGWTTIMMLIALSSSAQLLVMGVLGEYIGRIYDEVKRRPLYTVAERINLPGPPDGSAPTEPPSSA